jgi:hypothetical protein
VHTILRKERQEKRKRMEVRGKGGIKEDKERAKWKDRRAEKKKGQRWRNTVKP